MDTIGYDALYTTARFGEDWAPQGWNIRMEFRELRYFAAIAELSSFSKAAVQLRIAQPALSRQVHKLESELGVELFLRHGRGVTLTPAGEMLLQKASVILRNMRQVRDDVVSCASAASGKLTLGVPPAAGRVLMPPLLARYCDTCPNVDIRVMEGFSGHLHEWLVSGRADIAILHNPRQTADLIQVPLLEEEMYLISPPGAPATDGIGLDEVAAMPLILPVALHSLRQLVASALAARGHVLKPAMEVDGLAIIKGLVQYGLGHTVLTYASVAEDVEHGTLRATRIVRPGIAWSLAIVMRKDLRHNRAATQMVELMREEVDKLVNAGHWRGKVH